MLAASSNSIAERPTTSRRAWRSTIRGKLCRHAAEDHTLKLLIGQRPAPHLRGKRHDDAFVILRRDAVVQALELQSHIAPEIPGGFVEVVRLDAAQERDVPLSRLAVDADALDQDGLKARLLVIPLGTPEAARLRAIGLPSNGPTSVRTSLITARK